MRCVSPVRQVCVFGGRCVSVSPTSCAAATLKAAVYYSEQTHCACARCAELRRMRCPRCCDCQAQVNLIPFLLLGPRSHVCQMKYSNRRAWSDVGHRQCLFNTSRTFLSQLNERFRDGIIKSNF